MSRNACVIQSAFVRLSTRFLAALAAIGALVAIPAPDVHAGPPISIASGPSPRAELNAQLLVQVLKRSGFKATIRQIDFDQWAQAVRDGKVHILPEVSAARMTRQFSDDLNTGRVVDMGPRQARKSDPSYRKVAWATTRRRWTNEYKLIKNMTMPEADTQAMLAAVANGAKPADIASGWLDKNRERWERWRSVSRNWMKP